MRPLLALLLLATSSFAAPEPPPAAGPGEGPDPFVCCDVRQVRDIVERYTTLVDALAEGEPPDRITSLAYAFRAVLKPDPALDERENAMIEALSRRVFEIRNSADRITAELPDIGRDVIFLALRHEGGGGITVVEAFCPEGAAWLQRSTAAPRNPWGKRCARWR